MTITYKIIDVMHGEDCETHPFMYTVGLNACYKNETNRPHGYLKLEFISESFEAIFE